VRGRKPFRPGHALCADRREAGFATLIASNATTTIAPWGGKDTRIGNNPLGIGVTKSGRRSGILDMGALCRRACQDPRARRAG
jgi:LDH2 family malate/lactate/ureidoglycolate dehydrogenase